MNLIFATHNQNKVIEIQKELQANIHIQSLKDVGYIDEIEETGSTLKENALIKARQIYNKLNVNCFADDTGLEVDALNGEPGVYSARYAGDAKNDQANIAKILNNLKDITNRKARFKTVIVLILKGEEFVFEGIAEGTIGIECVGHNGFGYDPVFIPLGYTKTFAEMNLEEKNKISHRGRAFRELIDFLNSRK